jgi:hypothetical protein
MIVNKISVGKGPFIVFCYIKKSLVLLAWLYTGSKDLINSFSRMKVKGNNTTKPVHLQISE